jgi:hypothetical protein
VSLRVRLTWLAVQLAGIGLGIWLGVRFFHWAS